jgi:hypothetical protein
MALRHTGFTPVSLERSSLRSEISSQRRIEENSGQGELAAEVVARGQVIGRE